MLDFPDWERGVRLVGTDITLDIRIEASDVDLNIVFTDQSVAVFGAAAWFARQGDQVFVTGAATADANTATLIVSRTVPGDKAFFIGGIGHAIAADTRTPVSMVAFVQIAGTVVIHVGSHRGGPTIFDVPLRATAGQLVEVYVAHYGSDGAEGCYGCFWGYDEDA